MFNVLSKGLRKKGQGGTSRLLGDVEHTVWSETYAEISFEHLAYHVLMVDDLFHVE
jgi:hypothetical protein